MTNYTAHKFHYYYQLINCTDIQYTIVLDRENKIYYVKHPYYT